MDDILKQMMAKKTATRKSVNDASLLSPGLAKVLTQAFSEAVLEFLS